MRNGTRAIMDANDSNRSALRAFASTFHHGQLIGYVIQNKYLPPPKSFNVREDARWAGLTEALDEKRAAAAVAVSTQRVGQGFLHQGVAANMAMVKSGWLHRQSTILRRWKRNWFDLWADGRLVFYNDQHRRDMEDDIHMRVDCINIRSSAACQDLNPPEGKMRDALLQIVCRDGRVISLCADSADDALAWTMALQDARINTVVATPQIGFAQEAMASAPPPYSEYAPSPQQVYSPGPYGDYATPPPHATQIVYSADGQPYAVAYPYQYQGGYLAPAPGVNHVIIQEHQRDNGADVALGMLTGAATGLALGSLFSVF